MRVRLQRLESRLHRPRHRPETTPPLQAGKIERFHRTLNDGWAYAKFYGTETTRREALPDWIRYYNRCES
ncbi:integrase core domain-containing protein [Paenarthrobacter nitroguajacolicus]|uniref:integrase core domain-containing protein n=1 Tax=Paenarthrobacter nitroguajacolicus TaxID=211146 RepID=UPI0034132E1B